MCEQLNVAAFLWHSWAPRCLLSLCISNSTSAATQRCLIPNLFHFRHSRYPSVFLVCGFTVTSYAVSRGHPAPLVGKRLLADGLRVYFCLDSYLVYIHFAHTQDHDYVLYLCGGTSGIVWTVRFSLLSSKKIENEENPGWMRSVVNSGEGDVSTIIFINNRLL